MSPGDALSVGGVKLEHARLGAGGAKERPVLVLLHEGLGCVAMWKDFPQKLAVATGLDVFAYSRQGYGGSDPRPAPWPLDYMHDEAMRMLPGVLAAAGIEEAILIGHSDGASIALIHAGSPAAGQGTRIRALVAMAPHVFVEDISIASIKAARTAYDTTGLRARLERYHGRNVDDAFRGWNGAWLHEDFGSWNIEAFLPSISCPVLVLQGEDDPYGTPAQVEAVASGVGGQVRSCLIPDCRHSPHLDQPRTTVRALADFIRTMVPD
jgi:pimeloyl-ACP methyl ester carboxylesterase